MNQLHQLEDFYIRNEKFMNKAREFDNLKESAFNYKKKDKKINSDFTSGHLNKHSLKSKIFSILENLIKNSNISFFLYYLLILIETLQFLLLILFYANTQNSSFKLANFINTQITPYLTFLDFFNSNLLSFSTYFTISLVHVAIQIFILFILFLTIYPSLRENFVIKILIKICAHKIIFSINFMLVNELMFNFIVFKCVAVNQNSANATYKSYYFPDVECYTNSNYHLISLIINCINVVINIISVLFFSIMFNDFNFYYTKLPWSSPYTNIAFYVNIFKIKLVIFTMFLNDINSLVKLLITFIFLIIIIYKRYICPFYYHSGITKVKVFSEGLIISFTLILFIFLLVNSSFTNAAFKNPNYLDIGYLIITPISAAILYVYLISYVTKKKLLNFSNTVNIKNMQFYDIYINLLKLKDLIYFSKVDVKASNFLLTFYTTHAKSCRDFHCFCSEIEYLLKNRELQFKKNSHGFDDNMHFLNDSNVLIKSEDLFCLDVDDSNREELENNIDNLEMNKKSFLKHSKVDNMADKNVKYNKIWGKFLKELILKYVRVLGGHYKADKGIDHINTPSNSDKAKNFKNNSKNIYPPSSSSFYSLNPNSERNSRFVLDTDFSLIKIEFANLIMFFLRNPMHALREICLIDHNKLDFVSKFILFLTEKRILKQCKDYFFKQELNGGGINLNGNGNGAMFNNNNFSGPNNNNYLQSQSSNSTFDQGKLSSGANFMSLCEMKNILQYNMLWNKLCLLIRKNISNTKRLWSSLMKKDIFPGKIEKQLKIIHFELIEISEKFKEIEQINLKSAELDYKIFKIYGHYLNKIWKWEDEASVYIKKAYNEIVLNSTKEKISMDSADENLINPNLFNFLTNEEGSGNVSNSKSNTSLFDVFKLNDTGIVILNGDYYENQDEDLGKIIYLNEHLAKNICNFNFVEDLIGKNITYLMPEFLSAIHRHHIIQFYFTSHQKIINHVRPLFLLDKMKYFVPIKINIKILPGINRGLHFIAYIIKDDFAQAGKLKNSKIGYFLTDANNKILHFDKNAKKKLNLSRRMIFDITQSEEETLKLSVLFPELINYSKIEELKRSMNHMVYNSKGMVNYLYDIENEDNLSNTNNNIAKNILNSEEQLHIGYSPRTSTAIFQTKSKLAKNKNLRQTIKSPNHVAEDNLMGPGQFKENNLYNINNLHSSQKKKTFRMGVIDHRVKNPLIDMNESGLKNRTVVAPKNEGYLIYYVIFEKEKSDKISLAEQIRLKEEQLEKSESAKLIDDVGSIASSSFTNQFSNIQVLISSIKSSLSRKQSPGILKFVTFLFIFLVIILSGVVILQCGLVFFNKSKKKDILTISSYIYKQKYYMQTMITEMRTWQLYKVELMVNNYSNSLDYFDSSYQTLQNQISVYINEISKIQSLINIFQNNHTSVSSDPNIDQIIHSDTISLKIYESFGSNDGKLNYSETYNSLPNAVIKFIMNVDNYLTKWGPILNENYKNAVFVDPNNIDSKFITNLEQNYPEVLNFMLDSLDIFENFEGGNHLNNFYTEHFLNLNDEIQQLTNDLNSTLYYIFLSSIVVNFIFYFLIFLFLYLLTKKIYSIMYALIKIPFSLLEKCYSDANECEKNLSDIIYNDDTFLMINLDFILSDKLTAVEKRSLSEGFMGGEKMENGRRSAIVGVKGRKSMAYEKPMDSHAHLLNSNISQSLDADAEAKKITAENKNLHQSESSLYKNDETFTNSSFQFNENRLDDKFLKYDENNVKLQKKNILLYIIKQSLSGFILLYILFFNCIFLFDYFYVKDMLGEFTTFENIYINFHNLHYSLPEMFAKFRDSVIKNNYTKVTNSGAFSNQHLNLTIQNFDNLYNTSLDSLYTIDNFFKNEENIKTFNSYLSLFDYFSNLNLINTNSFCTFFESRMLNSILYSNISIGGSVSKEICENTISFKNGFELGVYNSIEMIKKYSALVLNNISHLTNETLTVDERVKIIRDYNFNKFFENLFDIFNPLFYDFSDAYISSLQSLIENLSTYSYIKATIAIILFIFILILYIFKIHSIYYKKFIYNKTMLLLIPIDYLKKLKDLIKNYI